jgi:tetratricopeptide (TPR) repeat protein
MALTPELVRTLSEMSVGSPALDLVEADPSLRERAIILELADQVNRLTREDIDRAERLAAVVSWLSELTADDFCRGRALRCAGNIQVMRGNYQQAVQCFQDSLQIFERLGAEAEQAAGLSSLIQPLIYLGNYEAAFDYAGLAWDIAQRHGDELLLARLDINFGNILHRQDRFADAVASYQSALDSLTRLGQHRDCAVACLNLAVCYISLNDFHAAESAYGRAKELSERENMPAITAQADYNIAYLHYYRSQYSKAIELYQQTRIFCQRSGDAFHSALCDLDQAEMYLDLRLNEEAAELAKQAEAAFAQLNISYEAAKAEVWRAVAAYQGGRLSRALELLSESRERMAREGNLAWVATLDLYRALVLRQEGRYFEALRLCREANAALPQGNSKSVHGALVCASLELELGRDSQAEKSVQHALDEAAKLQSPHLLFHAHRLLGKCREAQHRPAEAFACYRQSLDYLEQIPVNALADGFKIPYLKDKFEIYEALINLGVSSSAAMAPAAILDLVEKSYSREIADLVSFRANSLKSPSKNRSGLVEQLRSLREELNWYYRQEQNAELSVGASESSRTAQVRGLIRSREQSLLETLEAMRDTEAEFHSIQAAGSIPIERARACLLDDELLLELFEARGTIYAGLLTRSECQVIALTRAFAVREQLRRLNAHFVSFDSDESVDRADSQRQSDKTLAILRNLHDGLITPLREHLGQKRLLIARGPSLRYVPFHALFDGKQFLTERHVLSYTGNASAYFIGSAKAPIRSSRDVVIAESGSRDGASSLWKEFSVAGDLEQLRHSEGLRFVHLDCELTPKLDNPMFSTVKIGREHRTVLDLFNLELPCSIMSLRGVGAGISAEGDGKEIEGLARALGYAGARTLLMPIWNGRKGPTDLLLANFYREASTLADAPLAFQRALAVVRSQYPNPYDWAPFILRGQTGRIGHSL